MEGRGVSMHICSKKKNTTFHDLQVSWTDIQVMPTLTYIQCTVKVEGMAVLTYRMQ